MSANRPSPEFQDRILGSARHLQIGARSTVRHSASRVGMSPDRFWLTLLLLGLCQVADLWTFNLDVNVFGPAGELGPLGVVYNAGGIAAVAIVKLGIVFVVMTVLRWYPWQRPAMRRRLALLVATVGVFGAMTNLIAWF